ncbi:MAG: electron transport complex subunit RsxE [bacterium]|jgi:electron transport complex protein RnfE
MNLRRVFMNGIVTENPMFRLLLGNCPTLAVSTAAVNGLGMGAGVIFVLVGSNMVVSLIRNFVPDKIRIPSYIVVVATFVSITDMVMAAYAKELYSALGIFIPLIVVNCLIFARAEAFASKNPPLPSMVDGFGMGVGYLLSLTGLAAIREMVGAGTLFGRQLFGAGFSPARMFATPQGGFITLALLIAFINVLSRKKSANAVRG